MLKSFSKKILVFIQKVVLEILLFFIYFICFGIMRLFLALTRYKILKSRVKFKNHGWQEAIGYSNELTNCKKTA